MTKIKQDSFHKMTVLFGLQLCFTKKDCWVNHVREKKGPSSDPERATEAKLMLFYFKQELRCYGATCHGRCTNMLS